MPTKVLTGKEELPQLMDEELDLLADCQKCKMCLRVCPTYEGWYTQGPVGRLMAIYYYFKYGIGNRKDLSKILFTCTTCRRCQTACKTMSCGVRSTDIIIKARNLLARGAEKKKVKS